MVAGHGHLTGRLLPEARKLVDADNAVYERQYAAGRDDLEEQRIAEAVLGVLLIAALVLLQIHLARRFHRVFNPGLIAATLCVAQLLTITYDRMKVARRDSFDSVIALSRSKAIGYDANADESRYLLDPDRRPAYELSFLDKSQQLYGIQGTGLDTYDLKLADTWAAYQNDHEDKRFTGEYRHELDNITFAGEREAAEKTVEAYAVYQRDDRTFRRLVAEGKQQEAAVFCIGWASDTSNAHFGEWMKALDRVTAINQRHFDLAVRESLGALTTQAPIAGAVLLLTAGLTVLVCGAGWPSSGERDPTQGGPRWPGARAGHGDAGDVLIGGEIPRREGLQGSAQEYVVPALGSDHARLDDLVHPPAAGLGGQGVLGQGGPSPGPRGEPADDGRESVGRQVDHETSLRGHGSGADPSEGRPTGWADD